MMRREIVPVFVPLLGCTPLERALRKNGDPGTPGFAAPGEAGPEIHVELPVRVVGHPHPTNDESKSR